jgi:hypothetical protein
MAPCRAGGVKGAVWRPALGPRLQGLVQLMQKDGVSRLTLYTHHLFYVYVLLVAGDSLSV